jgi:hypothetical protein
MLSCSEAVRKAWTVKTGSGGGGSLDCERDFDLERHLEVELELAVEVDISDPAGLWLGLCSSLARRETDGTFGIL